MFRSRKSRRYVSRPKRNAERIIRAGGSLVSVATQQIAYTWTAAEACTIKSIKLDVGVSESQLPDSIQIPMFWSESQKGYNANTMTYPAITTDLYNPTDLVLISGIITNGSSEDQKYNSIGRKMKTGDRMALIFFNSSADNVYVVFEMNFTVLT